MQSSGKQGLYQKPDNQYKLESLNCTDNCHTPCVYIYIYIYIYICVCMYMFIYIYTHTHIYIYIYMCVCGPGSSVGIATDYRLDGLG